MSDDHRGEVVDLVSLLRVRDLLREVGREEWDEGLDAGTVPETGHLLQARGPRGDHEE